LDKKKENMQHTTDVIIIGAGPAGASTALYLEKMGVKPLVIDKAEFPREKICGDAISAYTVNRLKELGIEEKLNPLSKTKINRIVYSSPDQTQVSIKFAPDGYEDQIYGYVLRRKDFDYMLYQRLEEKVEVLTGKKVTDLLIEGGMVKGVYLEGESRPIRSRLVVGADGYHSIIARKMNIYDQNPAHWLVAVRAYFEGVEGMSDAIELHFADLIVPGYFWIFPVEKGISNVGLGMPKNVLRERKINLKKMLDEVIQLHLFKERFKKARPISPVVGWHLPIGNVRRKVYGNGFILVGDAAGLVDPFSGEGVGNSFASGKIAAEAILECLNKGDFSEASTVVYSRKLWAKLGPELDLSSKLLKMANWKWLINFVVRRASQSEYVRDWLGKITAELIPRSQLVNPLTYIKLLVK
jgi:geranylgeranyl reductase family protein